MRCVICGQPGEAPFALASGRVLGTTCGNDRCGALLWESAVCPPETPEGRAFAGWLMRRHVAERAGRLFSEPCPADAELKRWKAHLELAAMAGGGADAVPVV